MADNVRDKFREIASSAMERFLVGREAANILSSTSTLKNNLSPQFAAILAAFEQNVSGVAATVGMPVALAMAASTGSLWQSIHSAESIRALKLDAEPGEDEHALKVRRAEHAKKAAFQRFSKLTELPDERDKIAADACRFLLESLDTPGMGEAANDLLRQGVVLTWAAYEVLARDLFEAILNVNPKRILTVLQEPTAKHRLPSRFTLEELAVAGFDLSKSLGSILSSQQDFSDIRTIKAVMLPVLDGDKDVEAVLGDRALWVLCQQRHLIVHRRGVIDARYIEATGDKRQAGQRLVVRPDDVDAQLDMVVNAGRALLVAANKHAV